MSDIDTVYQENRALEVEIERLNTGIDEVVKELEKENNRLRARIELNHLHAKGGIVAYSEGEWLVIRGYNTDLRVRVEGREKVKLEAEIEITQAVIAAAIATSTKLKGRVERLGGEA
jgi:ribosome-associated translation inhibitor RaiA